jgi:hypothetical protein
MENFSTCFGDVVDPRRDNARHDLHELLVIALCAMLCGGEDCTNMALFGQAKEDFLRRFLRLRHGIPSHDTFSRLFRDLDPASFHAAFQSFMARFSAGLSEVIAIDGKTLRRSFDHASAKSPLHLVSAWASEQRLVLGQIAVDGKSNEITAVPKLLERLTLKGRKSTKRRSDGYRVDHPNRRPCRASGLVLGGKTDIGVLSGYLGWAFSAETRYTLRQWCCRAV